MLRDVCVHTSVCVHVSVCSEFKGELQSLVTKTASVLCPCPSLSSVPCFWIEILAVLSVLVYVCVCVYAHACVVEGATCWHVSYGVAATIYQSILF